MAEDLPSLAACAHDLFDRLSTAAIEQTEKELITSQQIQQERDKHATECVLAQTQLKTLTEMLKSKEAQLASFERLLAEERSQNVRMSEEMSQLTRTVKHLEEQQTMSTREEWHKARLVREQDAELVRVRKELGQLKGKAKQKRERALQKSKQISFTNRCEIDLQKREICELQDSLEDTRRELRLAQSSMLAQSKSFQDKDREVADLRSSMEILRGDHEREQGHLLDQLSRVQNDAMGAKDDFTKAERQLSMTREKWLGLQELLAANQAKDVILSIYRHLKRVGAEPARFCDLAHEEYPYITDCGTFLCSDCLCRESSNIDRLEGGGRSCDLFELDCRWCQSGFWTWEPLTIPYSPAWIGVLEDLMRRMNTWAAECEQTT